jgi:hypothetical protein
MPYSLTLPSGRVIDSIPDGVPSAQALANLRIKIPDEFAPPGALSQALGAPKNIIKGVGSGLVQSVGGLGGLGYGAARYLDPEMKPFTETGFGKSITSAEQYLAPTDEGVGSQFAHGLGTFGSMLIPAAGLGGLGTVIKGVAPRAAAPVGIAQTAGMGAEEARQRVENTRAEGQIVTPGQELGAMATGVPIGLTERIPVGNLFKALSTPSKLSPLDYVKRSLQQGGIEGIQEAGSGVLQDIAAQQIYNPNQEIGGSALKEGAMGAGVGAVAQTGLDLVLRKDIKRAYQANLDKKNWEETNSKIEEAKAANDKKIADTNAALGISTQLALPAPKEQVDHVETKHPLQNPIGNFTGAELGTDYLKEVNKIRDADGKVKLKTFSIEDLADAGAPQGELDRLLAYKTGFTGASQLTPKDVLNIAQAKNINSTTAGFTDFLRRATGSEDLAKMSQPQLHSAFVSLNTLPESDEALVLPQGTNATRFTQDQYNKSIKNLTSLFPDNNLLGKDETVKEIQEYSGLENKSDAESLLHTALRYGDLTTVSKDRFDLVDADGKTLRTYMTRDSAERAADKTGLTVKSATSINVAIPGEASQLPGGPDIRKGTFKGGVEPESYEVRAPAGVLGVAATQEEAEAKSDRLTAIRASKAQGFLAQASALEGKITKNRDTLESREAMGESGTLDYQKQAAQLNADNIRLKNNADKLKEQAVDYTQPLQITPAGEKPTTTEGYTVFDQNQPVATFPTQQAAEEHAISRLPDNILRQIIDVAPSQKGLVPQRLSGMATSEIQRRSGQAPKGFQVSYKGNKAKAEERLSESGIFTGEIKRQAAELDSKLRPLMNRLGLGTVHLNIMKSITSPEGDANGYYTKNLIAVAMNADNPVRALRHEGIHALKELGAFTKDQWRVLENKAKSDWIKKYDITNRYRDLDGDAQVEEAIADAFSDFDQTQPPAGLVGSLFNKIKSFMEALGNTLDGLGFNTSESIFSKVEAGGMKPTAEPAPPQAAKFSTMRGESVPPQAKDNPFKATPKDKAQAKAYYNENGIFPYLSESPVSISVEPAIKYSIKTADKYGFDGATGLPLNKDGSVTLYYPTTAGNVRLVNKSKLLKAEEGQNGIYLTNDSSGWKVMGKMGNIPQKTDGSVALLNVDPSLIQLDQEFEDGRKDFYIPTSEGEFFNKKMRMGAMYADRNRAIDPKFTYDKLTKAFDALAKHNQLPPAEQKAAVRAAKATLKSQHNINTLLAENGKLEKTRIGDYGLTTYDGKSVASLGLGLASAQRLNEKTTTCPNSAICEALCLGDTSGGNRLYGGMAAVDIFTPEGVKVSKTSFRAGPRLSQYLKTEAMIINPEAFAIVLDDEIKKFNAWSAKTTQRVRNPETNKSEIVDKEVYAPAIRLNVTSDFPPKVFKGLMDANPETTFYDYTKLGSEVIAPNHHLTYSSTGFSQVVDGKLVVNKEQNWREMMRRLNQGHNVAMAFSSKSSMPERLVDEETGKEFEVWDGDNYDARFLDPKSKDGRGMIVGLKNKAGDMAEKNSTAETNGFFVNYDPKKDGKTVTVLTQSKFPPKGAKFSRMELSHKDVTKRTPELQAAAAKVKSGEMTRAAYEKLVNKFKPVTPYESIPDPATPKEAINALKADQKDKYGIPSATLEEGHPVGLRLDIPAYSTYGTWVPAVHEQEEGFKAGKVIGYESFAAVTDPTLGVSGKAALSIAEGSPKGTIATIKGNWKPVSKKQAMKMANDALNDPSWTQVGMDPERHSYFYDRTTMEPVVSGDIAIQIGPLVLVHNPKYASKKDYKFSRKAAYAPEEAMPKGEVSDMQSELGADMADAINRTTTVRKTAGFQDKIAEAISPTSFTRARQAFINKYEAIENLTRNVAKQFGDAESLADVSAISAALFSDRAAGVAASSFMNGIPKYKNGFTKVSDEVKGLIPVLEPLMKPEYPSNILQIFQFYAGTRRGSRLLYETKLDKNGKQVTGSREHNFDKADIERGKILEKMYPEFKTVFDEYQKYNNGLVQFMKDTGVISDREADLWTKNWDYIPFYRQMEGESISAPSIFSSISGVTKPKELKGGEAPLADFLETVVRNARAAIEAGMKNVAAQRVVRDIVKIGQGSEVPSGTAGLDIVTVKQEGVTKYYKVNDPLLVESLKGLNLPNLPFVDILAAPANFLRSMVTKDPGYMMANMVRDSMQAWVTSGANITPILDTFKQYGKVISGQSPEAKALSDAGLFSGYDFSGDTKSSAKEVEKELRKRTGKRTILQTALLPGAKVWEMLDKGSHASDVATRAEIYKRTMESTGGNEAEALYQALEIMNFSRKGNSALIRIITALVPFMNARIQGMDVLYRTGFGKSATANREAQQKAFITRSMTMFSLSVMYWMLASDTEEYKTATQEERDNNWIFGGAKIPIPFELGVMFKVFPERILENFFGTDTGTDLKKSIFRNLTSTLVMNPIPHAFVPIVEHIADYSFFTGQEVVGKGMEGLATRYQAQPGTSLLAKTVGKETGASPVVLDNYIRGYTGTIGTYIVMAIDAMMHGEGDDIKASKRLEQMPVFRRFMSNKLGSGTVNAYYDLKKEVETSTRTINYLERQGRMDDMAEYLKGRGGKLQTIKPYIQELEKDMDGLRDFRRDVRIAKIPADRLAEIEDAIRVSEINLTRNIQTIKKAIE